MSGHTCGPWRTVLGDRGVYHNHERRLILGGPEGLTTIAKMPDYTTNCESAANAQIMAASLDMLEALKVARDAIFPSPAAHGESLLDWNDRIRAAIPIIQAAISKAEGA